MSWRNKLLWHLNLIDDVDYWLNYADSYYGKEEKWYTDPYDVFVKSINTWLREEESPKEDRIALKEKEDEIKKFIEFFIKTYRKINVNIVTAFISQNI